MSSISSNGSVANSAIVWAVSRADANGLVNLFAFNATAASGVLNLLKVLPAGTWASPNENANIIPVVANGKVYVASYNTLSIFGKNLPELTVASLTYNPTTGLFSSIVKNVGQDPTPSSGNGLIIGVGYFVDGKQVT